MHLEQRRGVDYIQQLTNWIYTKPFDPTSLQKALIDMQPRYIVDTNRDSKIQELLSRITSYNVCYTKLLRYRFCYALRATFADLHLQNLFFGSHRFALTIVKKIL